jgi:hypothetical protein
MHQRRMLKAAIGGLFAGGLAASSPGARAAIGCCTCNGSGNCLPGVASEDSCRGNCGAGGYTWDPDNDCEFVAGQGAICASFPTRTPLPTRTPTPVDLTAEATRTANTGPTPTYTDDPPESTNVKIRITDFSIWTLTVLPAFSGFQLSGGTVYLNADAFGQLGATSQSQAPVIFGQNGEDQVRVETFFQPDGTHNVYLYSMAAADAEAAANLVRDLAAQSAQPGADDVSKSIAGWDENVAQRFSFATDQGNLSRIDSVNRAGNYVVKIVDDRYGDRKNTVTLHRDALALIGASNPFAEGGILPDGAALCGSLPIVDGAEVFNWYPTIVDSEVVPRYQSDPERTRQVNPGVVNAFAGAYPFALGELRLTLYGGFREFESESAAGRFLGNYIDLHEESDKQSNLARWEYTGVLSSDAFAEAQTQGFNMVWQPRPDTTLAGLNVVLWYGNRVYDLALFIPVDGDPSALESTELGWGEEYPPLDPWLTHIASASTPFGQDRPSDAPYLPIITKPPAS